MELKKPVSQQNSRSSAASVAPTLAKRFEEPKAPSEAPRKRGERLFSLDLLRGLDIFILTVVGVAVYAIHNLYGIPPAVLYHFDHPEWVGFSCWDMIMPLFIFMCGAALPLALPKYLEKDGRASMSYWIHILDRVLMLWVLGMIAQGELFSFDLRRISFFNNTLQTIAVGFVFAALVARIPSKKVQIAVPFLLAAGYTAFLHLCGDFTPNGNAAFIYETKFLSLFYSDTSWWAVNQLAVKHYTWWATIPMFGVMGLSGYFATQILLNEKWNQKRKANVQMIVGLALVALGLGLMTFDPCIKHIFTASFTSVAMGICFILFSICYTLFDIRKIRFGTGVLILFGRRSLLAYMLAETCFVAVIEVLPNIVMPGLRNRLAEGPYGLLFLALKLASIVFAVYVWDWYKRGKAAAAKAAREAAGGTK